MIDFNLFDLKLSHCISTPWMYGSRGAQCNLKAGVGYALFSRTRCRRSREKIQESTMGPNRRVLGPLKLPN